ncbi:MAG: putative heme transporter [Thermoleophilaceae bacterium]|nr:putative heme transporter [Thermoleophilaceae bacterium]
MTERPRFTVEPIPAPGGIEMPSAYQPKRLARRALPVVALIGVLGLVVALAPGLSDVRNLLRDARPGWLVLAVMLEALSCVSYVLMFRPIFCRHMRLRTSWELGWSELGMGSIVPASGIGGLALGAWVLHQGGMPADQIARRSVAFFLIKGAVNFVAVAVVGVLMATRVIGPPESLLLTVLPAVAALAVVAGALLMPRLGPGSGPTEGAGRVATALSAARRNLVGGVEESLSILRAGDPLVFVGAIGYWAWDNAVLWAAFHAFGYSPDIGVVLMAYLIGQLGGLLPIPGGLGGIDGGLLGTFVLYGTPVAVTAAAVLAYRIVLFWLPLLVGSVAFLSLRRGLNRPDRPDLCVVPAAS